jgi:hypothetical protein
MIINIYLDVNQHLRGFNCPRDRPQAPVATPLTWDEVTPDFDPGAFTLRAIPDRISRWKRDPWCDYAKAAQKLPDLAGEPRHETRVVKPAWRQGPGAGPSSSCRRGSQAARLGPGLMRRRATGQSGRGGPARSGRSEALPVREGSGVSCRRASVVEPPRCVRPSHEACAAGQVCGWP